LRTHQIVGPLCLSLQAPGRARFGGPDVLNTEAVVIFIPRFAAVALGILLRPAAADAVGPAGMAGFDAVDTVFVGTVLDVWHLGDRQVARFVVDRPAKGTRLGEIIGVVTRTGSDLGSRITAGEQWMIVADPWLEPA
jgi:hypothetical protein